MVSKVIVQDLFPSLLSLLAPLREAEKPAQGHALVVLAPGSLVAGCLLCTWKGLHEPACLCHLPRSQHFTLAISTRSLPCTYSSWSLEFGMAVPVAQDSFTLFSLSLCLKKTQCPQGTYSQSCSAEVLSPRGLLPGLFLRPQGLVGGLPTPPI